MKTWMQSAATAAKVTGIMCFGLAAIIALSHAAAWLATTIGIVATVLLLTFIVFAITTVFVRIGSRVRAEALAEQQACEVAFAARRSEIDAKIQQAQALAQQASQWRPDASLH